jgi:hypothetical protein
MYSVTEQDGDEVNNLIDKMGDLLLDLEALNQHVLLATLFIAVKVCDDLDMDRKVFLMNCENMYDGQSNNAKAADGVTIQ